MLFKSKGETLQYIQKKKIKGINVPKTFIFEINKFKKNPDKILAFIKSEFKKSIAIRSCSVNEDSFSSSHAGEYKSFLNVDINNKNNISTKINEVIKSYKKKHLNHKILIQEMIKEVSLSGVALSCDITNYCSNYIVCNYAYGLDTTLVTSGEGNIRNFY